MSCIALLNYGTSPMNQLDELKIFGKDISYRGGMYKQPATQEVEKAFSASVFFCYYRFKVATKLIIASIENIYDQFRCFA